MIGTNLESIRVVLIRRFGIDDDLQRQGLAMGKVGDREKRASKREKDRRVPEYWSVSVSKAA